MSVVRRLVQAILGEPPHDPIKALFAREHPDRCFFCFYAERAKEDGSLPANFRTPGHICKELNGAWVEALSPYEE